MFRRTAPDAPSTPPGKTAAQPRRWGLYGPYIALAIALTVWTGVWLAARAEVIQHMDSRVSRLKAAGYQLTWGDRSVGGYPFRLDLVLTDLHGRTPGGWGLDARRFEAEAFMHAPGHWVFAAPEGLTLVRPAGGPVEVIGSVLHGSLSGLANHPPSLSLEGLDLRFSGRQRPFALTGADRFELHVRPGPDHQAAVLVRLVQGKADPQGLFGRIAGAQPVNLKLEAILSGADALKGETWSEAGRSWALSGGRANLVAANLSAGPALVEAQPASLTLTPDGRLSGEVQVGLKQGPESLGDLARQGLLDADAAKTASQDIAGKARISFRDGRSYLGPIPLGPSPQVF